jgi:hypothetical protein
MTQRHPGSQQIIRLNFAKEDPKFGFGRVSEWVTSHGNREYRLAKGMTSKKWHLYVRNPFFRQQGRPEWSLVRAAKGDYDFGLRLDDAKHNATIFLCLAQGPDHSNWRD